MPTRREAFEARRAKEQRLQKEAEEALLLAQYLRRKNAERNCSMSVKHKTA